MGTNTFGNAIPPVEIVEGQAGSPYRYELVHGTSRLYCSLAAGFKCVLAIKGFNKNDEAGIPLIAK
jgi:hypothetical protein